MGRAEQGQPALVGLQPGERRPPRRRDKSAAPHSFFSKKGIQNEKDKPNL